LAINKTNTIVLTVVSIMVSTISLLFWNAYV